jgi:hypothetical protein
VNLFNYWKAALAKHVEPAVREQLTRGETVTFDNFSVGAAGLMWHSYRDGLQALAWDDVAEIAFKHNRLKIFWRDGDGRKRQWCSLSYGGVPNVWVLHTLLRERAEVKTSRSEWKLDR